MPFLPRAGLFAALRPLDALFVAGGAKAADAFGDLLPVGIDHHNETHPLMISLAAIMP